MRVKDLPERVGSGIDVVREKTAEMAGSDGKQSIVRELSRLRRRIDSVADAIGDRLEDLGSEQERLHTMPEPEKGTTWPRRLFWLAIGVAAAAAAISMMDKQR